jgi:hypothetical protein
MPLACAGLGGEEGCGWRAEGIGEKESGFTRVSLFLFGDNAQEN